MSPDLVPTVDGWNPIPNHRLDGAKNLEKSLDFNYQPPSTGEWVCRISAIPINVVSSHQMDQVGAFWDSRVPYESRILKA